MTFPDPTTLQADDRVSSAEPTAFGAAWRYRWLVLAVVAAFTAAGVLLALARPPSFLASSSLVVEDPRAVSIDERTQQSPERYVTNQLAILRSTAVAQQAAEITADELPALGLTVDDFLTRTEVFGERDSDLITIEFVAEDSTAAQVGANALALAYQDVRRQEALDKASEALERVDLSQDRITEELRQLDAEIARTRGAGEVRQEIDQQFEEAVERLALLQTESQQYVEEIMPRLVELQALSQPSLAQQVELARIQAQLAANRSGLSDIQQQFQILSALISLEEQRDPELRALMEQQRSTIQRAAELGARRDQILVDAALVGGGVALFSPAQEAVEQRGEAIRTVAVAMVFGLLAGLAWAYFLALRRRMFTDPDEPEKLLGAPLLAEVPDFREEKIKSPLPVRVAPTSASAEAFRFSATSLDIRMHRAEAKSLAIVSGVLGEGKSTVLANTAIAAAREGSWVLVIDADFGNQALTELLMGEKLVGTGLTEIVEQGVPLETAIREIPVTESASLALLSRGRLPVVAPDFFRAEATRSFFQQVREVFDLILIDGPPLLQVAYASTLIGYADAVAVVVGHRSHVSQLEEVIDRLGFIGTPVAGYIYNQAPLRAKMTATGGSLADVLGVGTAEPAQRGRRRR